MSHDLLGSLGNEIRPARRRRTRIIIIYGGEFITTRQYTSNSNTSVSTHQHGGWRRPRIWYVIHILRMAALIYILDKIIDRIPFK
jgi:hypothetical protein